MSRGLCIVLGIAFILGAAGFGSLAMMGAANPPPTASTSIASFCAIVALACFIPASRPIALRIVGLVMLVMCGWLVWCTRNTPLLPGGSNRYSMTKAIFACVAFGLPGLMLLIWGGSPSSVRKRRKYAISRHGVHRVPDDAELIVDGIHMNMDQWEAIKNETLLRIAGRTPWWQVAVTNYGGWLVLIGIIVIAALNGWNSLVGAIAAVGSFFAWVIGWRVFTLRVRERVHWEVLAEKGHPICVNCGYNLGGLTVSGCPECGWRREQVKGTE